MSLINAEYAAQNAHAIALESRAAPRFTLLIRPAKIRLGALEYACVIRDISATGASIRLFHELHGGDTLILEHQTGDEMAARIAWINGLDVGLEFHDPIWVDSVIHPCSMYPKRDLRYNINLPVSLHTAGQTFPAEMHNISRQGALITCPYALAIDQSIVIEEKGLPRIEARVRWRKDNRHGLIFDTTFTLGQLALVLQKLNRKSDNQI